MYRRYRRTGKHYSLETSTVNTTFASGVTDQSWQCIVPPIATYGKRKVKNFTMSLAMNNDNSVPVLGALVYVPEGVTLQNLGVVRPQHPEDHVTTLLEPSQNVIMSFVLNPGQTTPIYKKTSLARNLDSSDKIVLVFRPFDATPASGIQITGSVSYAIKY